MTTAEATTIDAFRWWRALLAVLGAAAVLYGASTLDPDWVSDLAERPVAIVTLPCDNVNQAASSGFVIDDRTVVTVAHAIYESHEFAVLDAFGRWHRPEVVRLDLERDLAVLRVEELRATAFPTAPARPVGEWPGEAVRMVDGAASGSTDGEVLRRVRLTTEVIGDRERHTARMGYELGFDTSPGDSGALIADPEGRLVGVLFARSTRRSAISWATAAEEIDLTPSASTGSRCDPRHDASLDLDRAERRQARNRPSTAPLERLP